MRPCLLLGILLSVVGLGAAGESMNVEELLAAVIPDSITYAAGDGRLYSKNELEFLSRGDLTAPHIVEVSRAAKKENADPVPAIADFDRQLKALGIRLIVMPVPPKSAVYPIAGAEGIDATPRLGALYEQLRAEGVEVLDLTEAFRAAATDKEVFCRTDSHWSPAGIAAAVRELAERADLAGDEAFAYEDRTVRVKGDLAVSAGLDESEEVTCRAVSGEVFSEDSPVLLLSDSHGLVFSGGGDMLAENAGFGEQLALALGMPVDRIAVKGSASTTVRINLYRKAARDAGWLKNKKLVVWTFTCREFTESGNGWAKVPVLK